MTPISWTYKDFWLWFEQIEDDKRKTLALRELNGNGWLARLSADQQVQIFLHAPEEILLSLKHFPTVIKRRTLELLEYERNKNNRRIKRK